MRHTHQTRIYFLFVWWYASWAQRKPERKISQALQTTLPHANWIWLVRSTFIDGWVGAWVTIPNTGQCYYALRTVISIFPILSCANKRKDIEV